MTSIGVVNNRQVLYFDRTHYSDLAELLPKSNWMLFAIADKQQIPLLDGLAKTCLDRDVLYICGAGEAGSQIDDAFDMEIVVRKVEKGDDNYDDAPMTTWHNAFEESFWFATTVANCDPLPIETVVCLNLTEHKYQTKICNLIDKINDGWLPMNKQHTTSQFCENRASILSLTHQTRFSSYTKVWKQ